MVTDKEDIDNIFQEQFTFQDILAAILQLDNGFAPAQIKSASGIVPAFYKTSFVFPVYTKNMLPVMGEGAISSLPISTISKNMKKCDF